MFGWLAGNEELMWQLVAASVVAFFATLLLVPIILIRLPSDYFAYRHRKSQVRARHPALAVLLATINNLLGLIFVIAGIVMLVLPGQGILTILVGFMLLNFPGKYRAQRWLVGHAPVLRSINWIRRKAQKPPLTISLNGAA